MDLATVVTFIVFILMIYAGYLNKLYNALFTFVLVLMAAVIACNFFQPLGDLWPEGQKPYAYGTTFLLLFGVSFFAFQVVVTYLYPDNLNFSKLLNSLGGVFFGALTGLALAGVLAIGFYLLPLGPRERKTFLKFDRQLASVLVLMNEKAGGEKLDAEGILLQESEAPPEEAKEEPPRRGYYY